MDEDKANIVYVVIVLVIVISAVGYSIANGQTPIEGEIDEKQEMKVSLKVRKYKFRIRDDWYCCTKEEFDMIGVNDVVTFTSPPFRFRVQNLEITYNFE